MFDYPKQVYPVTVIHFKYNQKKNRIFLTELGPKFQPSSSVGFEPGTSALWGWHKSTVLLFLTPIKSYWNHLRSMEIIFGFQSLNFLGNIIFTKALKIHFSKSKKIFENLKHQNTELISSGIFGTSLSWKMSPSLANMKWEMGNMDGVLNMDMRAGVENMDVLGNMDRGKSYSIVFEIAGIKYYTLYQLYCQFY